MLKSDFKFWITTGISLLGIIISLVLGFIGGSYYVENKLQNKIETLDGQLINCQNYNGGSNMILGGQNNVIQ